MSSSTPPVSDYSKLGSKLLGSGILSIVAVIAIVYLLFRQRINRFLRTVYMKVGYGVQKKIVPIFRVVTKI